MERERDDGDNEEDEDDNDVFWAKVSRNMMNTNTIMVMIIWFTTSTIVSD